MQKVLAQAVAAALFSIAAGSSQAILNPVEGVRCPAGTAADFNNGVLKCRKTEVQTTASICPIQTPIYHQPRGADFCTRPGVKIEALWTGDTILGVPGSVAGVIPLTLPGDNQGWVLDRDGASGDHDRFTRTKVTYVYPENQIYLGNASRGVACPSGFAASFSGGTMKCSDEVKKKADCFLGSFLDQNTGRDRCLGVNGGDDRTLPQGELSRSGWSLDINGSTGNRDAWTKTKFEYPAAR